MPLFWALYRGGPPPDTDTTPAGFTFTDVSGVARSTIQTHAAIVVSGINAATPISISGGEYSKNGGAFTSSAGTVVNGDSVVVRGTSSGSYSTAVNVVLTIGGVSDTFTITTEANPGSAEAFLDTFGPWETSAVSTNRGGQYALYESRFNSNYASVNTGWPGTGGATYDTLAWALIQYIRGGRSTAAILNKGTSWWSTFKASSGFPNNSEQYTGYGRGLLGMWLETGNSTWANDLRTAADASVVYKGLASGQALDPDNIDFTWRLWASHTGRMLDARIGGITSASGHNYQTHSRQLIDIFIDQGQNPDGSLRTTNRNLNSQQIFMQGFACYQAQRFARYDSYRNAELLATIHEVADWVWSAMLDVRDQGSGKRRFFYIPNWDDAEGGPQGDFIADGTSLADVNGFWIAVFGYLYQFTGDPSWRTRMLQLFSTTNSDAGITAGRKQFEETFSFGFQVGATQALNPAAPGYPLWTTRPVTSGVSGGTLSVTTGATSQTGGSVTNTQYEWWYVNWATNEANGGVRPIPGATSSSYNSANRPSGTSWIFPRVRHQNAVGWSAWENGNPIQM